MLPAHFRMIMDFPSSLSRLLHNVSRVAIFVVSMPLWLASAQNISLTVDIDDLDPLDICGCIDSGMAVNNNIVYIYGASNFVRNGTSTPYAITDTYLRIVDFTSDRDLSEKSIMAVKEIPDFVTIFTSGGFWADEKALYVVGGRTTHAPYLTEHGVFVPHNWTAYTAGTIFMYDIKKENWVSEPAVQPSNGETTMGSFCCGNVGWNERLGQGYTFGGSDWAGYTQLDPNSPQVSTGSSHGHMNSNIMTFDTKTWTWSNKTTNEQLGTKGLEFGAFVFLPGTETDKGGIAISLGGFTKSSRLTMTMASMRQVLVFDSRTGSWYRQNTTAERNNFPSSRYKFCAVAVSANDNSSHSIYVYGGQTIDIAEGFSDMYVLSIPSFHWIRLTIANSTAQAQGSCAKLADRYMVTYGGFPTTNITTSDEAYLNRPCNWSNHGLRLFDLSNLAWTSSYKSPSTSAFSYAVPSAIYNVIGGNKDGGATKTTPAAGFETSDLATMFAVAAGSARTTSSSSTPISGSTSNSSTTSSSAPRTGDIVGAVAGGIVVVFIIAFTYLFWRRRRQGTPATLGEPMPPLEKYGVPIYQELEVERITQELEIERMPQELGSKRTSTGTESTWPPLELEVGRVPQQL